MTDKRRALIVGAGPAGLMAAEVLARAGVAVTVCDAMPSVGRKFLMAGRGGLNLTHSEDLERFLDRYGTGRAALEPFIRAFPPDALVAWCEGLGQETFTGSSRRVFPKSMKASPLLRAWLSRLRALGVDLRPRHRWTGWREAGALRFDTPDGNMELMADTVLLALGGASWPKLGSTGAWTKILAEKGVDIAPLQPANCGFEASWSAHFAQRFAGQPLKAVRVRCGDAEARGDAMLTEAGIEGGALYALGPAPRTALARDGHAELLIDLRPALDVDRLAERLARPRGKQSASSFLRKAAKLAPHETGLLREAGGGTLPDDPHQLARLIKAVPVTLTATRPLARAISTAGGVTFSALDAALMLRNIEGVFVAGEMLDWEAPTGGYLLQACFATGVAAAQGMLDRMGIAAAQH